MSNDHLVKMAQTCAYLFSSFSFKNNFFQVPHVSLVSALIENLLIG